MLRNAAIAELFNYALPGDQNLDAELTVRQLLDRAAAGVGQRYAARPEEEAVARYVLGTTFLRLGEIQAAHAEFLQAYANLLAFQEHDKRGLFRTLTRLIHTTTLLEGEDAGARLEERCTELALEILREDNEPLEERLRVLMAQVEREELPVEAVDANLSQVLGMLAADGGSNPTGVWLAAKLIASRPEVGQLPDGGSHLAGLWDVAEGRLRPEQIESLTLRWFVARSYLLLPEPAYREALREASELLAEARQFLPSGHWIEVDAERIRGVTLSGLGRFDEAEAALLTALSIGEAHLARPKFPLEKTRRALTALAATWSQVGEDWLAVSFERWRVDREEDPERTDWWVVRLPGAPVGVYEAAAAFLADRDDGAGAGVATMRAIALVRAGAYQSALEQLGPVDGPTATLFRVIAHRGLGQNLVADRELEGLDLPGSPGPELAGYLEEARRSTGL